MPRFLLLLLLPVLALAADTSALWGAAGEAWDPQGRLPDVRRAGYRDGQVPPVVPVVTDVRAHGAVGDGVADDTAAFVAALAAATPPGAVLVPAGRYVITDRLLLRRSGVVLRGAGPSATTLVFPRDLTALKPQPVKNRGGQPTSQYSWSGGFLTITAFSGDLPPVDITAPAEPGEREVTVAEATGLQVGQQVEVRVKDDEAFGFTRWVYADDPGSLAKLNRQAGRMIATVAAIAGNQVRLDRPLRFPLRTAWNPRLIPTTARVREVGIEDLACEFPATPYGGHFQETGFNAIATERSVDCWIRNIEIRNAESGMFINGDHTTVSDVVLTSAKPPDRKGNTGHHGISLGGSDLLVTRFAIRQCFVHDLSVQNAVCSFNVVSAGSAQDLTLDHHKEGPWANVFTDLDAGAGTRLWVSGGGPDIGRHAGRQSTFWNIRARKPLTPPTADWAPPLITLVGVTGGAAERSPTGRWIEPLADVHPADLHRAQVTRTAP